MSLHDLISVIKMLQRMQLEVHILQETALSIKEEINYLH